MDMVLSSQVGFLIKIEFKENHYNFGRGKGQGKGKRKWKREGIDRSIGREYHGVAIVYSPRAFAANNDFEQSNGRLMYTIQETTYRNLCIIDGYAPQSKNPPTQRA